MARRIRCTSRGIDSRLFSWKICPLNIYDSFLRISIHGRAQKPRFISALNSEIYVNFTNRSFGLESYCQIRYYCLRKWLVFLSKWFWKWFCKCLCHKIPLKVVLTLVAVWAYMKKAAGVYKQEQLNRKWRFITILFLLIIFFSAMDRLRNRHSHPAICPTSMSVQSVTRWKRH